MVFNKQAITPIGGQSLRGKAPQVYAYKTTDAIATVKASGYFNDFNAFLEAGDLIFVSTMNSSGAATGCYFLAVAANTAGVVTTAVAAYTAAS